MIKQMTSKELKKLILHGNKEIIKEVLENIHPADILDILHEDEDSSKEILEHLPNEVIGDILDEEDDEDTDDEEDEDDSDEDEDDAVLYEDADNTYQLDYKVTPSNATNQKVKWSSSNKKVITVDANGTVTMVGTGKAKVTVKTTDGSKKKAVCVITVKPDED